MEALLKRIDALERKVQRLENTNKKQKETIQKRKEIQQRQKQRLQTKHQKELQKKDRRIDLLVNGKKKRWRADFISDVFDGAGQKYKIRNSTRTKKINTWLKNIKPLISQKVTINTKLNVYTTLKFNKPDSPDQTMEKVFSSPQLPIRTLEDFNTQWSQVVQRLHTDISEFEARDSGWSFNAILNTEFTITQVQPYRVGQYKEFPKYLQEKHCILNMQCPKNELPIYCFKHQDDFSQIV